MKKTTSKIEKTQEAPSGPQRKTKKTSSKKSLLKNGLSVKEQIQNLDTSISIAKGIVAVLSSKLRSRSTTKYAEMSPTPEHLQILLQDLMDEIWNADSMVHNLNSTLQKKYHGICLL